MAGLVFAMLFSIGVVFYLRIPDCGPERTPVLSPQTKQGWTCVQGYEPLSKERP